MKNSNLLVILLTIFFVVFILFSALGLNYMHENAHRKFAEYNGCIDYEISYMNDAHFTCLERGRDISVEDRRAEYMLDGMNEIVTYNLQVVSGILLIGFFSLSIVIITVGGQD